MNGKRNGYSKAMIPGSVLVLIFVLFVFSCATTSDTNSSSNISGNVSQEYFPPPPPIDPDRVWEIGEIGPAGGIIFYDKGNYSHEWRYLEVAPSITELTAQWGAKGQNIIGTETTIGSGKNNTKVIVEHLNNNKNDKGRAAQICANLSYGGYTDWFLPSKDEFFLLYNTLIKNDKGDFPKFTWYWTSSQHNRHDAIATDTNGGGQFPRNKSDDNFSNLRVRAIRAF